MNKMLAVGLLTYLLGKTIETAILYLFLRKQEINIKQIIKGQLSLSIISAPIIAIILKLINL